MSDRRSLEDRDFPVWVYTLEYLAEFPLFKKIASGGTREHLQSETLRLIDGTAEAPKSGVRFSEGRWDSHKRKTDTVLRLARLIKKMTE
jgi:hypothetical protein